MTVLPFWSSTVIVPPSTSSRIFWPALVTMRQHAARGVGGLLAVVPVAADPDRIGDVAALELDPDAGADLGQEGEAHVRAGKRHAGPRPAGGLVAEHRRHARLDAHRARRRRRSTTPRYLPKKRLRSRSSTSISARSTVAAAVVLLGGLAHAAPAKRGEAAGSRRSAGCPRRCAAA